MLIRSTQGHLAAVLGSSQCRRRPLDWASDSWRNSLLLTIPTCWFFSIKKKRIWVFFITFDSNFFQAIQTTVFYKKITFKMFKCNFLMFLYLKGSCDKKIKAKGKKWSKITKILLKKTFFFKISKTFKNFGQKLKKKSCFSWCFYMESPKNKVLGET